MAGSATLPAFFFCQFFRANIQSASARGALIDHGGVTAGVVGLRPGVLFSKGRCDLALVVHLKKDQQVVINGAVIENTSCKSVTLRIKNEAAVLRADDILAPDAAATPATRVYYALQCLYLFSDRGKPYLEDFHALIESYVQAAPSAER